MTKIKTKLYIFFFFTSNFFLLIFFLGGYHGPPWSPPPSIIAEKGVQTGATESLRICACPNESREMFRREPSRSSSLKLCPNIVFIYPDKLGNRFANLRCV